MLYKYGEFTDNQIRQTKVYMRKQIFFLLLIVDPQTKDNYPNVDVDEAFSSLLRKFGGLNDILLCPPELVRVVSILEAALKEYHSEDFAYARYRKLILDAGAEVLKIEEVE